MATAHTSATGKSTSTQSLEVDIEKLLSIQLERESDEGLTVKEWAEKLNTSPQHIRKIFNKAFEMGILKQGKRIIPASQHFSGRAINKLVYTVTDDGD